MINKTNVSKIETAGSQAVHLLSLFLICIAFWLTLSGSLKPKFIVYGVLASAATAWISYPLLLVPNKSGTKQYFVFGVPAFGFCSYCVWLLWQLILANIDVLKATTGKELAINPRVVRFYFKADNPMAYVMLANSITLTPGTVTINVTDEDLFEIHALTDGAAAGVLDGSMQKKVAELYGGKFYFAVAESEGDL